MTKFTDAQLVILSAAAQREDRAVACAPAMTEATWAKAARQLMKRGCLEETAATADMPIWRSDAEEGSLSLVITPAGLSAIGVDAAAQGEAAPAAVPGGDGRQNSEHPSPEPLDAARQGCGAPREGSKLDAVLGLLKREGGASIAELTARTGWLPHTTRAALTGLRKRGYTVLAERGADGATYRLGGVAADAVEHGPAGA